MNKFDGLGFIFGWVENKRNLSREGGREEGTESPKFQQNELVRVTITLGSSGVCLAAKKLNEKREAL
ncbi:unnamed protein product [Prunus armeniaca]